MSSARFPDCGKGKSASMKQMVCLIRDNAVDDFGITIDCQKFVNMSALVIKFKDSSEDGRTIAEDSAFISGVDSNEMPFNTFNAELEDSIEKSCVVDAGVKCRK